MISQLARLDGAGYFGIASLNAKARTIHCAFPNTQAPLTLAPDLCYAVRHRHRPGSAKSSKMTLWFFVMFALASLTLVPRIFDFPVPRGGSSPLWFKSMSLFWSCFSPRPAGIVVHST